MKLLNPTEGSVQLHKTRVVEAQIPVKEGAPQSRADLTNPEPLKRPAGSGLAVHVEDQRQNAGNLVQSRVALDEHGEGAQRVRRGRTSALKVASPETFRAEMRRPVVRQAFRQVLDLQDAIKAALQRHES